MTDELVAWLREQVDEDGKEAQAATSGPWRWRASSTTAHAALVNDLDAIDYDAVLHIEHALPGQPTDADAAHIARHDPARVLAEAAAKRRIIDLHSPHLGWCRSCGDEAPDGSLVLSVWPCGTIRLLASVYAGRPGWRSEWAPDEEVSRG